MQTVLGRQRRRLWAFDNGRLSGAGEVTWVGMPGHMGDGLPGKEGAPDSCR